MKVSKLFESTLAEQILYRGIDSSVENYSTHLKTVYVSKNEDGEWELQDGDEEMHAPIRYVRVKARSSGRRSRGSSGMVQHFLLSLPGWSKVPNRFASTFCSPVIKRALIFVDRGDWALGLIALPPSKNVAQMQFDWNSSASNRLGKVTPSRLQLILTSTAQLIAHANSVKFSDNELSKLNRKFADILRLCYKHPEAGNVEKDETLVASSGFKEILAAWFEFALTLKSPNGNDILEQILAEDVDDNFKRKISHILDLEYGTFSEPVFDVHRLGASVDFSGSGLLDIVNDPERCGVELTKSDNIDPLSEEVWFDGDYNMIVLPTFWVGRLDKNLEKLLLDEAKRIFKG